MLSRRDVTRCALTLLLAPAACRRDARPPDIALAAVAAPTPARLYVGATRRSFYPWSQRVFLTVRDHTLSPGCPGDAPNPQGPFADALIEDATGARIAFRCGPGAPWGVAYVTPTRAWLDCAPPRTGATLAWEQVPTLVDAAGSLARCPDVGFAELAAEVRRLRGDEGVEALVYGSLSGGGDPVAWNSAFSSLPHPARRRIRDAAGRSLTTVPLAPGVDVDRAARVADFDAAPLDADRLEALLRRCEPGPGRQGCDELLRRMIRVDPDRASSIACGQVNRRALATIEAAALARSALPCEPMRTLYLSNRCAEVRERASVCGDDATPRPCTRADYLAALDAELTPGGVTFGPFEAFAKHRARVLGAAALRQGIGCVPGADSGSPATPSSPPPN